MKKWVLAGLLLFVLKGISQAVIGSAPQPTYQVGVSSISVAIVTITTTVAIAVDSPTISGRVTTEIQNIDSTANLWCTTPSTAPTTNNGRKIAAGNSWIIGFVDKIYSITSSSQAVSVNFWCISDGAASTKAAVTQLY